MSLVDETSKEKLSDVVKRIETLQDELNKDTLTSIDAIRSSTRRPIFDLKQAIAAIIGEDNAKTNLPTEEPGKDPLDDGFGGSGGN
jgi:hypothetical protein